MNISVFKSRMHIIYIQATYICDLYSRTLYMMYIQVTQGSIRPISIRGALSQKKKISIILCLCYKPYLSIISYTIMYCGVYILFNHSVIWLSHDLMVVPHDFAVNSHDMIV